MTLACPETRLRFAAYLDDRLGREERSAIRAHLASCAACRGEASGEDPALLFASMGSEPVSAEDAGRVLDAVRAGIALKTAERRIASPARRFAGVAAAAAAAALLAITVGSPAPPRAPRELSARASVSHASDPGAASVPAAGASALPPVSPFAEAAGPATGKLPADATIYDWNPGGGQPRVVWIVDRSLDI
ncbi:MAG: zf-HC2 domain-containing protein [Acidobacteriota bacterium]